MACLVSLGTGSLAWAVEDEPVGPALADAVLVGAGGIASCDTAGDEATAKLIEKVIEDRPDAEVFTAGDNAYEKGTATQFAKCYDKTWGKFKDRTHPASGNHDHGTSGAGPYYSYFGEAAGEKGRGWYSYDLGAWHILSLNSNCKHSSKCAPGSEQVKWLKADLAASRALCTAAVIHHPRFSSDKIDGNLPHVDPLWDALYAAGADLVVSGHARVYERFAPQTPDGVLDQEHGLPLINAGTGGRGHAGFIKTPVKNSVVRDDTSWGVLKLTLKADSFDYKFIPIAGKSFTDSGSGDCHGKPAGIPEEPTPEPETESVSFGADADATVAKKAPNTNYGSKSTLLADKDPMNSAYLRFTVPDVEGTVDSARLRLWVTDGSGNGPSVYRTDLGIGGSDPPWSESAITWNKRPARSGGVLDDLGSVKTGKYVELDVSDVVNGEGRYSFELAAMGTDGTDFASSENSTAARRPQLILDVTPPEPEPEPAPEPPVTEPAVTPPPATEPPPPAEAAG
jgi:acid phosphatase type 7